MRNLDLDSGNCPWNWEGRAPGDLLGVFWSFLANGEGKWINAASLGIWAGLSRDLEKEMATHSSTLAWRTPWTGKSVGLLSIGLHRVEHNWSDLACMHSLEKEMATHSSILAWRIPGTEEPGGRPSTGSHRVGRDWSNSAASAAAPETSRSVRGGWEESRQGGGAENTELQVGTQDQLLLAASPLALLSFSQEGRSSQESWGSC